MKNKITQFGIFSALLLTPFLGVTAAEVVAADPVVHTEAGKINFDFTQNVKYAGAYRKVARIHLDKHSVELSDGSIWHVNKIDTLKGWDKYEHIVVTQNPSLFSTHRYALVNADLKLAESASLVREPTPSDKNTLYIVSVDHVNSIVHLNDGRQFIVHSSDQGGINHLSENDRVILGVNIRDLDAKSPYILIDTNNKASHSVRVSLLK
jgi:hypothetical protein